jgi:hypothetical protein
MHEEKEAPLECVPELLPPITHKLLDPARLQRRPEQDSATKMPKKEDSMKLRVFYVL